MVTKETWIQLTSLLRNIFDATATIVLSSIISKIFSNTTDVSGYISYVILSLLCFSCNIAYNHGVTKLIGETRKKIVSNFFSAIPQEDISRISEVFEQDLNICVEYENRSIPTILSNVPLTLVLFAIVFRKSILFACILFFLAVVRAFITISFRKIFSDTYEQTVLMEEKIKKFYFTILSNIKKCWFLQSKYISKRLNNLNEEYFYIGKRSEKTFHTYKAVTESIDIISQLSIFLIGLLFVVHDYFALSDIMAILFLGIKMISMVSSEIDLLKDHAIYSVAKRRVKESLIYNIRTFNIIRNFKKISYDNFRPFFLKYTLSFDIHNHDCLLIKGKNGSGKSTIIKSLLNLQLQYSGIISIDDYDTKEIDMRELSFYVPQNVIKVGLYVYELFSQFDSLKVKEVIKQFNFNTLSLQTRLDELSSGELKTVQVMCAFMSNKPLLVFDEPENSLDEENRIIFIDSIKKSNKTIIITTNSSIYDSLDFKEVWI